MSSEMLKQANKIANSNDSITNIKCPRDIKNPGLWFGFILGWLAAQRHYFNLTK